MYTGFYAGAWTILPTNYLTALHSICFNFCFQRQITTLAYNKSYLYAGNMPQKRQHAYGSVFRFNNYERRLFY